MRIFILILFLVYNINALELNSGKNRVNLIELYSSEGCSSCPIADEWVNKLTDKKQLFKSFIPLVFHVTYWDFLGWKDSFAKEVYDKRQRYYSTNVWNKNSVYTPQFIINKHEYKQWFKNRAFPKFEDKIVGNLNVKYKNDKIDLFFNSNKINNKKLFINIATLGFDYKIDVLKGENYNKTLEHNFVVLNHVIKNATIKNSTLKQSYKYSYKGEKNRRKAIVVWLSDKDYNIIQATGGYL